MINFDLKNRVAVVTGGAQGFGLAITERFIASGASVVIWDKDEEPIKTAIKKIGAKFIFEKADRTSVIFILFEVTRNSIKVPPLKSIPRFKPLILNKPIEINIAKKDTPNKIANISKFCSINSLDSGAK